MDEPRNGTGGKCAPGEPEQEDTVAMLVVAEQEGISLCDIRPNPVAPSQTPEAAQGLAVRNTATLIAGKSAVRGAHAGVVIGNLTIRLFKHFEQLCNIGFVRTGFPDVACTVTADNEVAAGLFHCGAH